MNEYELQINGKNFHKILEGKVKNLGFFTNVYVEAETESQAEKIAIGLLRNLDELYENLQNKKDDPPMFIAEEIIQIANYQDIEPKIQGIIWYQETDKNV